MNHRIPVLVFGSLSFLLGSGCAYNPGAEANQAQLQRLASIEAQIAVLGSAVEASQDNLSTLEATQLNSAQALGDSLDQLSLDLELLPTAVAELCRPPEPKPAPASATCEPGEPLRTVIMNSDKLMLGELENVWLDPPGASLVARLDTGATSSSLHAQNLTKFERDGEEWVRFELQVEKQPIEVERRVLRHVLVIQQADPEGSRRPVVQLRIRIGNLDETVDFTLADRSHLENEVILGRNFLSDVALVDVGQRFIQPVYEPDDE
ncbi:MAG: ATP-dependent zinc protease [Pseudomonadales bacterium]|nr:ATP-dependent zinc protease [Pseudomonadales bacterium]